MSTYLKLCQKTRRDCEIPGDNTPVDVTTQTGELLDLVERVSESWVEIQNSKMDWRWMQRGFTMNTVANRSVYNFTECTDTTTLATVDRFSRWIAKDWRSPMKAFKTSAGIGNQGWLWFLPWNEFELIYRIASQTPARPVYVTIDPQDNLVFGPEPDDDYTISGNYQLSAQVLTDAGDIPEMPKEYHDLIVHDAIQKYGYGEAAQEIIARGEKYYSRLMHQLKANQLNPSRLSGPLA